MVNTTEIDIGHRIVVAMRAWDQTMAKGEVASGDCFCCQETAFQQLDLLLYLHTV